MEIVSQIIDASEVWAPVIPLIIYFIKKPSGNWVKPIFLYLLTVVILNSVNEFIFYPMARKKIIASNHIFYNVGSLVRLAYFTWFFNYLHPFFKKLNRIIPACYVLVLILTMQQSLDSFNSMIMTFETAFLLIYCISWFNIKIRDENTYSLFSEAPSFAVVGITIYAAVNFILFLFFKFLIETENDFAYYIWDVHNGAFIIMCILFAKSLSSK